MRLLRIGRWIIVTSLMGGAFWALQSCAGLADDTPAVQLALTFLDDIQPLLKERCWKCHGAETRKADLGLHTPDSILKGGESGVVLVAGNSAESRLYELVKHGEMPPDQQGTLNESEVELIRRWIDAGALFDSLPLDNSPQTTQHDVIPILLLRCTACHGRHRQEGGLDLRDKGAMLRGGKSGPALVPGKPGESLMLRRILAEEMPPHARLIEAAVKPMDPAETKTLTRWIELGAPLANDEPDRAGTIDDPLVRESDRDFWSFQPPQQAGVPNMPISPQIQSPVDAFIAQKLREKSLTFAHAADRLTLLRRVTYDLTGLPPEPRDAQEFLTDPSPDALERVVDQLLASPKYGERWGRHWLDVAGYADCEGRREQHLPRPVAWRYRDYVIRSFNSDKPYDRFLLEQIAGDELEDYEQAATITPEIEDNLVATAFLRMAPDPTWANLTGFVPDRLEVMADSIDVLGSGVLGLTFKCARCHTHKFDPIPQRDYYSLIALLKGAYDEHDWLKPQIIQFGGAYSAGIGERFLPYVTTAERQAWEQHQASIQRHIEDLTALPKTLEIEQQIRQWEAQRQPEPKIMALWDRGEPSPTYLYRRGNHATSGAFVSPNIPAVLKDPAKLFQVIPPWPGAKSTGRRLALARWLVGPDHPLTSRVMVNRLWKHHFGQGIVRSLGNFGKTGERPTHPELLDYLARSFIRQGWSMKAMHRQMILTTTYQQASQVSEQSEVTDSDNRLLSRMPLGRLDAEQLRDSILKIAGMLNDHCGGTAEPVTVRADGLVLSGQRRSIYVQQLRKHPPSLLESFDFPSMNPNCLQRSDSLVPTQALHLWNDAAIRQLAVSFSERIAAEDRDSQIEQVYWIALGRPARPEELAECRTALDQLVAGWLKQNGTGEVSLAVASRLALATLCHTIINSADFLYVD